MPPLITVIIPVYKVEKYIRECVDSVIKQTYTNLEIILVDDGSPDECGAICDELEANDSRIKVIHKCNGGLSDARNAGMDYANGEYITFVDGDDWIASDMLSVLYQDIVRYDADIACCGYYHSYKNGNIPAYGMPDRIMVFDRKQAIAHVVRGKDLYEMAWGKLYKRKLFRDLRFPSGKAYEDTFVIVDLCLSINMIVMNTSPRYFYRQRKSSAMHSQHIAKLKNKVEAYEHHLDLLTRNNYVVDETNEMGLLLRLTIVSLMIQMEGSQDILKRRAYVKTLRQNSLHVICNDYFTLFEKIKVVALQMHIQMLKCLYFCKIKYDSHRKKQNRMVMFD